MPFSFCALRRNLRSKPSILQEAQLKKLRAMIKHAYEDVPFYHRRLNNAGIKPEDIKTFEDLAKVPFTTKAEIQSASVKDISANNSDVNKGHRRSTSGSTGIPLTVFVDKRFLKAEKAFVGRAYFENGVKLWDRVFRVAEPDQIPERRPWRERLGILRTEYCSVFDDMEKQAAVVERYRPDVLRGYSSFLEILADSCREKGKTVRPRLIFSGAELLDNKTRQAISSVFQANPLDLYSACEFGHIAWECREHSGYHVNVEGLLLEIVKNGEQTNPGEQGEIVCTGLLNELMPLIRYKIGDMGTASSDPCPCGVTLPLLKIIGGRVGDYLITTSGRPVPPTLFFPYPFDDVTWIKQFRIIQESKYKITIEVSLRNGFAASESEMESAKRRIREVFGEDMELDFKIVETIRPDSSGKLRKIISHVPISMNL